jgi:hypothetical protein
LNIGSAGQEKAGGLILNTGGAPNGLIVQQGNVGIGTVAPGSKLSVSGIIESFTGGFKFPDGTIQTTKSCQGTVSLPPRNSDTVYQNTRSGVKIVIISIQAAGSTDFSSRADISADGAEWTRIAYNASYSQFGNPAFELIFAVPPGFFYRVLPSDTSVRSSGAL